MFLFLFFNPQQDAAERFCSYNVKGEETSNKICELILILALDAPAP